MKKKSSSKITSKIDIKYILTAAMYILSCGFQPKVYNLSVKMRVGPFKAIEGTCNLKR
jgi:hypothetical protein